MQFRTFLIESESDYKEELKKTISKIPKAHAALIKGFKYIFQGTNTLKNDGEHVGLIDQKNKKIVIASPWNYGREYTLLHEIGHLVYENFMTDELKKQWKRIVERTKDKQNQGAEELFCMAYANTYAKNKIEIHSHGEWEQFIKKLPK